MVISRPLPTAQVLGTTTPKLQKRETVERIVYTPEMSASVASSSAVPRNAEQGLMNNSFTDNASYRQHISNSLPNPPLPTIFAQYRDGIHSELREPSMVFDLGSLVHPAVHFNESILSAPATSPYVPSFAITSQSLPWKITISSQAGCILTVYDVLYGIINFLQRPAAKALAELSQTDWVKFFEVDNRRKRRVEKDNLDDPSARHIDWLSSEERIFMGLSSEKGSVMDSTERILK
ncbi:hypothetical protein C0995_003104, partial [Termitomyces sp. Mi166